MTQAELEPATGYRLRIGDPATVRVSVVRAPHLSVLALLSSPSAVGSRGRVARATRASVGPGGRFALRALASPGPKAVPDVANGSIAADADTTVAEQAERLRQLPARTLRTDLRRCFGTDLPAPWRPAAVRPRRWLDSLAVACEDGWSSLEPIWQRSERAIERERRRVELAVAAGAVEALLGSLHPGLAFGGGRLTMPCSGERTFELGDRPLVLVPMIAPVDRVVAGFEQPHGAYIGYPVEAVAGPRAAAPATSELEQDPLVLVLGQLRAHALRAIRRPLTAGALARELSCAASTVSYHCEWLELTGLLVRERRGNSVLIRRTERGAELVRLFG